MVIMEYVSSTGISLWTLTCVVYCLLICVKPGLPVMCNGALCGYGTGESCRANTLWCSCQSQFKSVHTENINNQNVQICLEICHDKPCPPNYQCVSIKSDSRCLCANGYKRSTNGECVESCSVLNCGLLGRRCLEKPNGDVCESKCAPGFTSNDTGGCIDVNECFVGSPCANNAHSTCWNTPGSYRCNCVNGYKKSSNSDMCEDIDECAVKTTCEDKQNTICVNSPAGSFQCDCLDGYDISDNNECEDIDECLNKTKCEDKQNTLCVNTPGSFQCDCILGYNRSTHNNDCKDIDECLYEGICGKNNNTRCVNTPGSFNCECLPGYTSDNKTSCQVKITVAELSGANGGSSVGLYVGVTVGVLVLLGLVVAAIFVRRRRNSKKSHEGIAEFSSRESEHNENPTNVYDNVSLEHEHVDLHNETRTEKTVSVEYSNGKIPRNKLARNSSSIIVEYSNNKILASTKRNGTQRPTIGTGGSEEQGSYSKEDIRPHNNRPENMVTSPNPIKADNLNESGVYNTLDAFSLNTTNEPKIPQHITGESECHFYGTPYEERVLPNSINKENMATFPNLVSGQTFDDHEAYNTLDAFNLNTQSKPKTETRIEEDHDPYNKIL